MALEGIYVVTGGTGHLGTAICSAIEDAGGDPVSISMWKSKYQADATDKDEFRRAINDIYLEFGEITGLVHIVGDVEICVEELKDHVSTIVTTGSLWGSLAPNHSMYLDLGNNPTPSVAAQKGSILAVSRYYAGKLAPIRVNTVSPGWIPKKKGSDRPDYLQEIESRTPLGRIGVPDDVAGAYVFLLSDEARFITGQNLVVDGGYSIW